ncbi:ankyrin repeat domain-containing protein [Actinopolymorpha alba]|uniref:globin domain-containing protein n=1 Tax=Actinopolymorpha alba TaxID=533267 RepID=UPI00037343B1|nr:ankyrin repeat domain-containing protein [Actinopolymorpha alba]
MVTRAAADQLRHRRLLDARAEFFPFRGTDLFVRIGGQPTVDALVDHLYDAFEDDPVLRPLFPRDLTDGRAAQKIFFAEWLGGEYTPGDGRRYSDHTYAPLRHRHDDVTITRSDAGRWLAHFRRALEQVVPTESDRTTIFDQAKAMAHALVNAEEPSTRRGGTSPVAACGVAARTLKNATDLAHKGDTAGVAASLAQAPDLRRASYGARLLQVAAMAGRVKTVEFLLRSGVGPDRPHYLPIGLVGHAFERVLLVTPLCAARLRHRTAVEAVLLHAGAAEDVFTSAFLGDVDLLRKQIAAAPELAETPDPAADVIDITPVDHAVAGGQVETLRLLLDNVRRPLPGAVRALRGAAEKESLPMVKLLLDGGADATLIGAGRWVLHPQIAPLLAARGASVRSSGSWIGLCCTGNQGRKDDPEYVRALLRHGARADDRRTGDPFGRTTGVAALAATGLHYAAKAGFVQTIEVLLEHGADPRAKDSQGRTPLDWLEEAAPTVDRESVRRLLTTATRQR